MGRKRTGLPGKKRPDAKNAKDRPLREEKWSDGAFMNVTAGAAVAMAFKPLAFAGGQERKSPVPYPDPAVEVVDPRFGKYVQGNAAVERLYTGTRWSEGPVWFGDGRYLLWSDIRTTAS